MLETIISAVLTLIAVGLGFFMGRLPVDATLSIPKLKRKTKPQPVTVNNHAGRIVREEPEVNPLLDFKEPG